MHGKGESKSKLNSVTCDSDFEEIGKKVLGGGTVIFPTDTIYGLGSNPRSDIGIEKCYEIKNRQVEKKLPVLFSSLGEAEKMVKFNPKARLIADRFWPGQVTMILSIKELSLPNRLHGENSTLAVRIPDHGCCLRLIASCGNSLIGTSANLSGTRPFADPDDSSLFEFAKRADYFVKGKCGNSKLPSTILDLSQEDRIVVVREGAVPSSSIFDYLTKTSSADFSFSATTT